MVSKTERVIEGVGIVLIVKSRRARRLNMTLESSSLVRVAVPSWVSFKEAERILRSNVEWIQRFIKKAEKSERAHRELIEQAPADERKKSKWELSERIRNMARQYGLNYNKLSIRNQKTRWGSCSHSNNISLNIKLLKLPERLIDYVILHELVHTKIKSHGTPFWAEMSRIMPNARKLDEEIKKYQLRLL